jgi:radical SAM protein with 4Fe4S-binding SPASM domain
LQENNVKYTSFFTTNGYLFDKDIIKKAKELWHITSCQITLDGTEYVYNKAKNYIYSDPSPYKRVLDNIEELINNKVGVMIRMNVDMHNADNLKELVYELYGRFGNNKYLTPYCYPIFENEFFQRNEGERAIVFQKIAEIEEILNECRMYTGTSVRGNIRIGHCMVDNGRAITISPNGDFGLCEHYVDTDFWGHVDRPDEMDMDMIRSWRVYEEDLDICSDCPIYPRCVRASKCEEQSKCYPEYKEWLIRKAKMGIKTTYYSIMDDRNKRR